MQGCKPSTILAAITDRVFCDPLYLSQTEHKLCDLTGLAHRAEPLRFVGFALCAAVI